jgi:hypothetical protein
MASGNIVLKRRDTGEKQILPQSGIASKVGVARASGQGSPWARVNEYIIANEFHA